MNKLIFIFMFLISNFSINSQSEYLSKSNMIADIDSLIKKVEYIHPYPYRFITKDSLLSITNKLKSSIPDSLNINQFWRIIDEIMVKYNDAHSRTFPNLLFDQFIENGGFLFPFEVTIDNKTLIIHDSHLAGYDNLNGKKIICVNDIKSEDLIEELKKHAIKETESLKKSEISQDFKFYLWKTYGWEKFAIEIENQSSKIHLEGVTYNIVYGKENNEKRDWFKFKEINNKTCLIKIRNFNSSLKQAKKEYKKAFKKIKKNNSENLILDFRDHDGGQDNLGLELARYLSAAPIKKLNKTLWNITPEYTNAFENEYIPKSIRWIKPLYLFNEYSAPLIKGKGEGLYEVIYKEKKPYSKKKRYTGSVYLLINNNTFSAGSIFADIFQYYNLGKIIGQSSGNLKSFSGYPLVNYFLPNSQIKVRISSAYSIGLDGNESRTNVQTDISLGKDEDALEYLINLLDDENNNF